MNDLGFNLNTYFSTLNVKRTKSSQKIVVLSSILTPNQINTTQRWCMPWELLNLVWEKIFEIPSWTEKERKTLRFKIPKEIEVPEILRFKQMMKKSSFKKIFNIKHHIRKVLIFPFEPLLYTPLIQAIIGLKLFIRLLEQTCLEFQSFSTFQSVLNLIRSPSFYKEFKGSFNRHIYSFPEIIHFTDIHSTFDGGDLFLQEDGFDFNHDQEKYLCTVLLLDRFTFLYQLDIFKIEAISFVSYRLFPTPKIILSPLPKLNPTPKPRKNSLSINRILETIFEEHNVL